MIDYILWLLEPPSDEEEAEPLTWKTWSQPGRKGGQETVSETEVAGDEPVPEDQETRGERLAEPSLAEEAGRQESQGLGPLATRRERALMAAVWRGSSYAAAEAKAGQVQRGEDLMQQAVRLRRGAAFAGEQRWGAHVQREESVPGIKLPDLRGLDRAFQRDARRYDGGFPLL